MRAIAGAAALLLALAGCGQGTSTGDATGAEAPGAAKTINFYNWSSYINPDTLPAFEKETGVSVNYDVYDSNDVLEGKLLAGNTAMALSRNCAANDGS